MRWPTWLRSDCSACWRIPTSRTQLLQRSETVGLFLGTAIHDTSQVVGAALTYRQMYADDVVLRVATVTKLTRNLCLAGVIPLLAWMHLRASRGTGAPSSDHQVDDARAIVRPWVSLAMAMVRTIGDATLRSIGRGLRDVGCRCMEQTDQPAR